METFVNPLIISMLIKRCFAHKVTFFMGGELWNPKMKFATKDIVYVFVELDSGEFGVGEVWSAFGSPETLVHIVNNDISPLVAGEDPHEIEHIREKVFSLAPMGSMVGLMTNALSGVDIALWDLRGKLLGQPLGQLLGSYSESVYAYASGGLYGKDKGLDELASEVRGYVEEGFTGVKMKIGGVSISEDTERVAVVRDAIGLDTRLMVDSLHTYNVDQAMEAAKAIREHNIYWFESPLALDDMAGHGIINSSSGIDVCANESLSGVYQFKHLLEHGGAKYVHFDLSVCGGITEAIKIAALAENEGLKCTIHSASGVSLFATSVHFASSIPNCDSVEYHFVHQWLSEHKPEALVHEGPMVKSLGEPGIGTSFITPDFIEQIAEVELAKAN
jgi:L-alanine-DL-glutamate epimerase-like enolase superfamily enzyme